MVLEADLPIRERLKAATAPVALVANTYGNALRSAVVRSPSQRPSCGTGCQAAAIKTIKTIAKAAKKPQVAAVFGLRSFESSGTRRSTGKKTISHAAETTMAVDMIRKTMTPNNSSSRVRASGLDTGTSYKMTLHTSQPCNIAVNESPSLRTKFFITYRDAAGVGVSEDAVHGRA